MTVGYIMYPKLSFSLSFGSFLINVIDSTKIEKQYTCTRYIVAIKHTVLCMWVYSIHLIKAIIVFWLNGAYIPKLMNCGISKHGPIKKTA